MTRGWCIFTRLLLLLGTSFFACENGHPRLLRVTSPQVPKSPIFLTHATRTWNMEIIFHQPRFPWNKRSHFPWLNHHLGGPKSCEVAIIWPNDQTIQVYQLFFIFTWDSCFSSKIPLFLLAFLKKKQIYMHIFVNFFQSFLPFSLRPQNRAADQSTSASSTCWECSEAWWWYNSPGRELRLLDQ